MHNLSYNYTHQQLASYVHVFFVQALQWGE